MPLFKANINYVPHNFNSSELMFNDTDVAKSAMSFAIAPLEDDVEMSRLPDGTSIIVEIPSRGVLITAEISDASPTTDVIWDLYEAGDPFNISFSDANAPNLKASAPNCRVQRRPEVKREGQPGIVTWLFLCPYGEYRGGSYALITP